MSWFKPNDKYKLINQDEDEDEDEESVDSQSRSSQSDDELVDSQSRSSQSDDDGDTPNNKYKIKNYIENIYKFLGDKYCFVSGAFVIEDDQQDLLELLQSVKNYSLKLLGTKVIYTHTKYKAPGQNMSEIHFSDKYKFKLSCKCTDLNEYISRPVRNIKWYPFTTNRKNYIYLKLETHGTKTLGHVIEARVRYGPGKKIECVKSRREDCDREKESGEQCRYKLADPNKPFESPETIIIEGERHNALETYTRKGDEEFIPQALNDYLIANNDKNLLFSYDSTNNSVSIQKEVQGGVRKRSRTTRKRSRSRNVRKRTVRKHMRTVRKHTVRKRTVIKHVRTVKKHV